MSDTIASLAEKRYVDPQSSSPFPLATTPPLPGALATILAHRSARAFLPSPLPPGTLETLLVAAQSASTSSLLQSYSIIAIQEPTHKSHLATLAGDQDFIRQAPLFLVFCPDLRRLDNLATQYETQPAKALDSMDTFITSTLDAGLAGQNVAIAAESLGLGICYVGAVRNNAQEVCALLNLPPLTYALFGLAIGYPACEDKIPGSGTQIKPRLPMREVLHRETFSEDVENQRGNIRTFDQALGAFYERRGKATRVGWGEFVAEMLASGDLEGRERVRGVLEGQGFKFE